jgi:hypothetical protein
MARRRDILTEPRAAFLSEARVAEERYVERKGFVAPVVDERLHREVHVAVVRQGAPAPIREHWFRRRPVRGERQDQPVDVPVGHVERHVRPQRLRREVREEGVAARRAAVAEGEEDLRHRPAMTARFVAETRAAIERGVAQKLDDLPAHERALEERVVGGIRRRGEPERVRRDAKTIFGGVERGGRGGMSALRRRDARKRGHDHLLGLLVRQVRRD